METRKISAKLDLNHWLTVDGRALYHEAVDHVSLTVIISIVGFLCYNPQGDIFRHYSSRCWSRDSWRRPLSCDVGLSYLYIVINGLYYGVLVLVMRRSAYPDACTAIIGRLWSCLLYIFWARSYIGLCRWTIINCNLCIEPTTVTYDLLQFIKLFDKIRPFKWAFLSAGEVKDRTLENELSCT